jgi:hypothetical protein
MNIPQSQHRAIGVIHYSLRAGSAEYLINFPVAVMVDHDQICIPLVCGFDNFFPIFPGHDL